MIDSDARTVIEQLERRNKEIEIIERVASQISKTLNLDAIAKTKHEKLLRVLFY